MFQLRHRHPASGSCQPPSMQRPRLPLTLATAPVCSYLPAVPGAAWGGNWWSNRWGTAQAPIIVQVGGNHNPLVCDQSSQHRRWPVQAGHPSCWACLPACLPACLACYSLPCHCWRVCPASPARGPPRIHLTMVMLAALLTQGLRAHCHWRRWCCCCRADSGCDWLSDNRGRQCVQLLVSQWLGARHWLVQACTLMAMASSTQHPCNCWRLRPANNHRAKVPVPTWAFLQAPVLYRRQVPVGSRQCVPLRAVHQPAAEEVSERWMLSSAGLDGCLQL